MTLHKPRIPQTIRAAVSTVLHIFIAPVVEDEAPKPPKVGDVVLTRRGWYGEILEMTDKGYTLHMVYIMADGAIIRPGNTKQCLRRVWLSEVQA